MQGFTVPFCFVSVQTSMAFTTHKPLLPMWLLYTQLAQFATTERYNTSTDGSIPVLSSKLLHVTDTSNQTFVLSLTEDQLETFNVAAVTHCEQMCSGCK